MPSRKLSRKCGYLMVEVFVAISISLVVMSTVYVMLSESMNLIKQTDSRIELREQFDEMATTIKRELRNSNNLKFYYKDRGLTLCDEFIEIDRINFSQFENVNQGVVEISERVMYIEEKKKKIFIYYNGGAYEIGNYVEKIEVKQDSEGIFSIKLKLNKNNNRFSDIISIRMRN